MVRKYNIDNTKSKKQKQRIINRSLFSVIVCPKSSSLMIRELLHLSPSLLIISKLIYYE